MTKRTQPSSFLGETASFVEAYPSIETLDVYVEEQGDGPPRTHHYTQSNFRNTYRCTNSRCKNGGFEIGSIVLNMELLKLPDQEYAFACEGKEAPSRNCYHSFKIALKATYKAPEQ